MPPHRVALITDSTCDIPHELLEQYEIQVVPAYVIWGSEVLRDHVDLAPEAFYHRLAHEPVYPKTSQPTPQDLVNAYKAAQARGAEEIVIITVSSAMSGTFRAAQQTDELVSIPVHVVDAKGPTMSVGWQVLAAARARQAGGDAQAMVQAADGVRKRLQQFVYLDTLEYLYKGGRIGSAARAVSALLNIKLIVHINHETGLVEEEERTRTRSRSVESLYRGFFRHLDQHRPMRIAVLHGNCPQDAAALAERVRHEFAPAELLVSITGPVLGVHTGPGALALCGYNEG
ncbi:MAG TPA: DegV family protein [Anaerolineae bacterium]|nr:DegV family protein [Anaerolineae bacterium]HOQ99846.1 DegV family protein [Anaerolineae bacterium]HPL30403.1 DegV family protein [Anaerolineae bacterium]